MYRILIGLRRDLTLGSYGRHLQDTTSLASTRTFKRFNNSYKTPKMWQSCERKSYRKNNQAKETTRLEKRCTHSICERKFYLFLSLVKKVEGFPQTAKIFWWPHRLPSYQHFQRGYTDTHVHVSDHLSNLISS